MATNWKLSDEQKAEACRRYEAGETSTVLAAALGIRASSLCQLLRRRGVKMRPVGSVRTKPIPGPKMCADCGAGPLPNRRFDRCQPCGKKHLDALQNKLQRECSARMIVEKKCPRCYKANDNGGVICNSCLEIGRQRHQEAKAKCMEGYGGKCACCGETEIAFLSIDHVNDDGAHQRRIKQTGTVNGTGEQLYRWLIRNGFPKDHFQCLCMNCQWGKRLCGTCPHKTRPTPKSQP